MIARKGSIIYSHLNDSLLLDRGLIAAQFHGVSEAELQLALQQYRDFCLSNFDALLSEISPGDGKLRLFVGEAVDDRILKQGAFYLDAVIISDPLFKLTQSQHEFTSAYAKAFNFPTQDKLDRKELVQAVKKLLSYQFLVASGYVHLFPTSLEYETPSELPLYASSDGFESVLPPHLLSLYKDAADVRSVRASPQGLLVMKDLEISRMISVDFDGKESGCAFGFNLMQQELASLDRKSGRAHVSMHMPEMPPSKELFESWSSQSVNRAALMHFDMLNRDVRWSARFGAQYLSRSRFAASILESTEDMESRDISSSTTSGLLNLNLQIFDNVSMARLMDARSDEEAFRRFRMHLEKSFRELRLETDPVTRLKKTENAMHELTEIQLTEVDSAIRRLKRKGILTGVGAIATLAATTATSGASLIATMYAAYSGYRTFEEYRIATKESPAYFLWRVIDRKQQR